jgi:hypothetical protein
MNLDYLHNTNTTPTGRPAGQTKTILRPSRPAFGAPVGGLLFAMEEVSSFWKNKLSFQVFFCCITATFTTEILNSAFHGFKYKGDFGLFKPKFISRDLMVVNVIAVAPAILLGTPAPNMYQTKPNPTKPNNTILTQRVQNPACPTKLVVKPTNQHE